MSSTKIFHSENKAKAGLALEIAGRTREALPFLRQAALQSRHPITLRIYGLVLWKCGLDGEALVVFGGLVADICSARAAKTLHPELAGLARDTLLLVRPALGCSRHAVVFI
jgi:hypothetical protein